MIARQLVVFLFVLSLCKCKVKLRFNNAVDDCDPKTTTEIFNPEDEQTTEAPIEAEDDEDEDADKENEEAPDKKGKKDTTATTKAPPKKKPSGKMVTSSSGNKCKYKYMGGGVSQSDADLIVKKHNDLRELIKKGKVKGQPKGINLKTMKWDDKLAVEAQKIADTCIYAHVVVDDSRWPVGQNLYKQTSTAIKKNIDWDRGIQGWFDEYKLYTYGPDYIPAAGHYTQVVWADTEYVGCGYTFYETNQQMKYEKLYACNYGPGGNVIGDPPYKTE